jgi:hypothetical protein
MVLLVLPVSCWCLASGKGARSDSKSSSDNPSKSGGQIGSRRNQFCSRLMSENSDTPQPSAFCGLDSQCGVFERHRAASSSTQSRWHVVR